MEATTAKESWMQWIGRRTGISTVRAKFRHAHELMNQTRCGMYRLEDIHQRVARLANRTEIMFGQIDTLSECFSELRRHRVREYVGLLRSIRKHYYLESVRSGELLVPQLFTEHPIAMDTDDTRHPRGAKADNSICARFNQRMYQLLGQRRPLKVLDLGCAGGGLVRSLIDDGHLAVGLEGSDFPLLTQKDEWSTIPYHLHTCDIAKPFALNHPTTGARMQFDAITAWEVMEHIPENGLPTLFLNIRNHLAPDGWVLFSVSTVPDGDEKNGWVYHLTIRQREWWYEQFEKYGFLVVEQDCIGKDDWLRGSGNCYADWVEDQNIGFHVALRHARRVPAPHFNRTPATTGAELAYAHGESNGQGNGHTNGHGALTHSPAVSGHNAD